MGSGGRPHIIGRIIVFSANFVFWVSGILLIVFGSIALADPATIVNMLNMIDGVSYVTPIIDVVGLMEGVSIFMIVLGCFLFLLGANGCHGILGKSKKSIMMYMLWLLVSILVEIGLIIYASVYPHISSTTVWIQDNMYNSLKTTFVPVEVDPQSGVIDYASPEKIAMNWQMLQFETKCCGAWNWTDFKGIPRVPSEWNFTHDGTTYFNPTIPPSCCTTDLEVGHHPDNFNSITSPEECLVQFDQSPSTGFNVDGCWKVVDKMLWQFCIIAICISSCLIAAQLLGLLFSIPLWRSDEEMV